MNEITSTDKLQFAKSDKFYIETFFLSELLRKEMLCAFENTRLKNSHRSSQNSFDINHTVAFQKACHKYVFSLERNDNSQKNDDNDYCAACGDNINTLDNDVIMFPDVHCDGFPCQSRSFTGVNKNFFLEKEARK